MRLALRRLMPAVQVAVSLVLLGLLFGAVGGREALSILASADPGWLLAALGALTLQTALSAKRWQITAARLGQSFGFLHALKEYYLAQIVNQTLPGGMVGDASRAVRARHHAGLVRAGQAVAFERFSGQAALFVTMAVAFVLTFILPGGLVWPAWLAGPVALACIGTVAVAGLLVLSPRLPGAVGRALKDLHAAFEASLLSEGVVRWQVALAFATTACNIAAFAFCARATGTALPMGAVLGLVPLILFTMLVPVTVSGWGLREGAAAALFPVAGASAAAGLAASVTFGLVFIVAVLPGLLPLLRLRRQAALGP
jgi:uncharacterized membrane protein YbhN (UPF0104 family)